MSLHLKCKIRLVHEAFDRRLRSRRIDHGATVWGQDFQAGEGSAHHTFGDHGPWEDRDALHESDRSPRRGTREAAFGRERWSAKRSPGGLSPEGVSWRSDHVNRGDPALPKRSRELKHGEEPAVRARAAGGERRRPRTRQLEPTSGPPSR